MFVLSFIQSCIGRHMYLFFPFISYHFFTFFISIKNNLFFHEFITICNKTFISSQPLFALSFNIFNPPFMHTSTVFIPFRIHSFIHSLVHYFILLLFIYSFYISFIHSFISSLQLLIQLFNNLYDNLYNNYSRNYNYDLLQPKDVGFIGLVTPFQLRILTRLLSEHSCQAL